MDVLLYPLLGPAEFRKVLATMHERGRRDGREWEQHDDAFSGADGGVRVVTWTRPHHDPDVAVLPSAFL